jgi:hypothetical protein
MSFHMLLGLVPGKVTEENTHAEKWVYLGTDRRERTHGGIRTHPLHIY